MSDDIRVPLTIRQALQVFVDKYDRAHPADPHEIGLLHRHFAEARAALLADLVAAPPTVVTDEMVTRSLARLRTLAIWPLWPTDKHWIKKLIEDALSEH